MKRTSPSRLPLEQLIEQENGNISNVAKRLGVSRQTVYSWRETEPTEFGKLKIAQALRPAAE